MDEFNPKISERTTEELIEIANSSKEVWVQDAIRQAKNELIKRNISKKQQDEFFNEKILEINDFLENEEQKTKRS